MEEWHRFNSECLFEVGKSKTNQTRGAKTLIRVGFDGCRQYQKRHYTTVFPVTENLINLESLEANRWIRTPRPRKHAKGGELRRLLKRSRSS